MIIVIEWLNLVARFALLTLDNLHKGRHQKKKTADLVKMSLLGGRGSEKLLNLQFFLCLP